MVVAKFNTTLPLFRVLQLQQVKMIREKVRVSGEWRWNGKHEN